MFFSVHIHANQSLKTILKRYVFLFDLLLQILEENNQIPEKQGLANYTMLNI